MLANAESLQELHNRLVLVVAKERELTLAELDVQLLVDVGRVDLPRGHLLVGELVVAAEAELNDSDQLSLLLERQIAILEYFTLAERYSHKSRVLLRVEKVVLHVLKFQVGRRTRPNQLIHRLALRKENLGCQVNVAGARHSHELVDQCFSAQVRALILPKRLIEALKHVERVISILILFTCRRRLVG